jgi:DNA-binding response OmpR family regulator
MRLLVVEDDRALAAGLRAGLEAEGFAVDLAGNGVDGLGMARDGTYDAVLLDLMLPRLDGRQVCRRLREACIWTPVLVLTARDQEHDEVDSLDAGADDYLSKPFSFPVLLARLRSLTRRGGRKRSDVLVADDLRLDTAAQRVWRGDAEVVLTARERALLEFLLRRHGEVVSKRTILDHVWGDDFEGDANIVEVYIGHLRNKVDRPFDRGSIQTVRGAGYRIASTG